MSNYSTLHQAELNLSSEQFVLTKHQTTHQVRLLIKQLIGKHLTAQEILRKGRSGFLQLSSLYGSLIITADSEIKNSRLWRWSGEFIPVSFYCAS
ncbi:MAG: hypothetical protein SFY66_04350 [Oculatellaceae cyanobacterium bins.114]|nr:hypothetical protein [Oculatellaceae cyanobacterium bins.114]